eukprot:gene1960-8557_t
MRTTAYRKRGSVTVSGSMLGAGRFPPRASRAAAPRTPSPQYRDVRPRQPPSPATPRALTPVPAGAAPTTDSDASERPPAVQARWGRRGVTERGPAARTWDDVDPRDAAAYRRAAQHRRAARRAEDRAHRQEAARAEGRADPRPSGIRISIPAAETGGGIARPPGVRRVVVEPPAPAWPTTDAEIPAPRGTIGRPRPPSAAPAHRPTPYGDPAAPSSAGTPSG